MKLLTILLGLLIFSFSLQSQSLKKYPVANSGCSLYTYCNPGEFEITYSPDSSVIYTGECSPDSISYGIICVKLKETVKAGDESDEMMINYLDYLRSALKIKSGGAYGKGHTMEKKADARGIIDYWTGEDGTEWKVKSWCDGKFIAVMYVFEKGKLESSSKHEVFLNGFRFPGM